MSFEYKRLELRRGGLAWVGGDIASLETVVKRFNGRIEELDRRSRNEAHTRIVLSREIERLRADLAAAQAERDALRDFAAQFSDGVFDDLATDAAGWTNVGVWRRKWHEAMDR